MKIGKKLYVASRSQWRSWLRTNHKTAKEIWLIYYKKNSEKPRIPYNDAVEEALCFGWIDSIVKAIDDKKYAQRYSPRKPGSKLSAMNRERVRRLIRQKRMTPAGLAAIQHAFKPTTNDELNIPTDIIRRLKSNRTTWKNFQNFPESYKRIRIGWIEGARRRPEVFKQRLDYFVNMTRENKKFGMVQ